MKMKKALCFLLAAVMTASIASVPVMAAPSFGGTMLPQTSSTGTDEFFDKISEMDYTAEHVRLAVYTLGVSKDMTYAFKGMLKDDSLDFDTMPSNVMMDVLAEVGVKDMSGLANFMKTYTSSWQVNPISINDPEAKDGTFTTTTLTINQGSNTPANSYTVSGAKSTYDASTVIEDIVITSNPGYNLKSVNISGTNARVRSNGGNVTPSDVVYFNDLVADEIAARTNEATAKQSVTLKSADLGRKKSELKSANVGDRIYLPTYTKSEGGGLFGDSASISGTLVITVTTEPKEKGNVTVSGDLSVDGLYTFSGANYRSASALTTAITAQVNNSSVSIGDTLSFSYDTKYIQKVNVKAQGDDGDGTDYSDGSVFFTVPEKGKDVTITVTSVPMSKKITVNAENADSAPNNVTYTFGNTICHDATELQTALNDVMVATPADTQLSFTVNDPDNAIDTIKGDGLSVRRAGSTVTFNTTSEADKAITITFKKTAGGITISDGSTGLLDHITSITAAVNGQSTTYSSVEDLNDALKKLYVDTVVNLTFALDSNYSISSVSGGGILAGSNTVNQIALTDDTIAITLTINASEPIFTLSRYSATDKAVSELNGSGNAVYAVADVVNVDELSDTALQGAEIEISAALKNSTNKVAPTSASKTVSVTKAEGESYAGISFEPKEGGNIQLDYTYDVNATFRYNGGSSSKSAPSMTVSITGIKAEE